MIGYFVDCCSFSDLVQKIFLAFLEMKLQMIDVDASVADEQFHLRTPFLHISDWASTFGYYVGQKISLVTLFEQRLESLAL